MSGPRTSLDQFAQQLLDDLCARHPMGYRPDLQWRRLRVTAGLAYTNARVIALSLIVLTTEEAVQDTLTHEYAHLLAVHRHGRKAAGHGRAWKEAMHDLGAEPRVYHSYCVQRNRPRQQVTYRCERCGRLIERRRRLPSKRLYVHSGCGGPVSLYRVQAIDG
jgi:predicted SprT family Zn-dependent metalloprotease